MQIEDMKKVIDLSIVAVQKSMYLTSFWIIFTNERTNN